MSQSAVYNPAGNSSFGNLTLEFFIADNSPNDQNGEVVLGDTRSKLHGEGKIYIGFCTTDANGIFGIGTNSCTFTNAGSLGLTLATNITATATDSDGNTSEFSASPTDCNLVNNTTADRSNNTVVVEAANSSNPILGGGYGSIKFKVTVKQ